MTPEIAQVHVFFGHILESCYQPPVEIRWTCIVNIIGRYSARKRKKNSLHAFRRLNLHSFVRTQITRTCSDRIGRTLLMSRKLRFYAAGRVRIRGYRWVVGGEWIIERACVRGQVFLTESCSKLFAITGWRITLGICMAKALSLSRTIRPRLTILRPGNFLFSISNLPTRPTAFDFYFINRWNIS